MKKLIGAGIAGALVLAPFFAGSAQAADASANNIKNWYTNVSATGDTKEHAEYYVKQWTQDSQCRGVDVTTVKEGDQYVATLNAVCSLPPGNRVYLAEASSMNKALEAARKNVSKASPPCGEWAWGWTYQPNQPEGKQYQAGIAASCAV
jgi:hypothetical protein